MSGWFDLLAPAEQEKYREKFSRMGSKASILDKARAAKLGTEARWKGHKKKEKTTDANSPKTNDNPKL